ncbi:alpha/beta hydrolase [Actinomadura opuntiae]|uniref:alpha/beta hydrolase n=1 Tax=Actinomadura sp. OS1-43 TaxID=604315 RepID=UPI00255AD7EA|nr:alpha/beta hydrolase [Actinomadura sp. OS1-43]MDL4821820.1 alpha/beta hydrolase [Actinomadura sp. OS1-43]
MARALARLGPAVPGSRITGVRAPRGEWVRGPGVGRDDTVILYLHGSAYLLCSARTHRGLTSRLSAATGLPVFACDYRLAPEHRFPYAAADVRQAYDWLRQTCGYDADRIVVAGDSAGGHLAVDLALQLERDGLPGLAALVLFSPLIDLSLQPAERRERIRRDPMISAATARRLVGQYIRDADPESPRLVLAPQAGERMPPTLVQAGGAEMLAADAEHLAEVITAGGGRCELQIWPGQMHVFHALPRIIPESRAALSEAAAFVREIVAARSRAAA